MAADITATPADTRPEGNCKHELLPQCYTDIFRFISDFWYIVLHTTLGKSPMQDSPTGAGISI